jgi:hypothetical protein
LLESDRVDPTIGTAVVKGFIAGPEAAFAGLTATAHAAATAATTVPMRRIRPCVTLDLLSKPRRG